MQNNPNNIEDDGKCKLCGNIETQHSTQHFIFECSENSEGIWEILSEACSDITGTKIKLHLFHVIYNQSIKGMDKGQNKDIECLIQEIKRNIGYRRYQREVKIS